MLDILPSEKVHEHKNYDWTLLNIMFLMSFPNLRKVKHRK